MSVIDDVLARITPVEWAKTHRRMGIPVLIVDTMEAKGMTQREFAQKIGKKTAEIPLMLSGNYNYTIEELTQIEFALDTKLFFSIDLDWWLPEDAQKSTYEMTSEPLLEAAEPEAPYGSKK
jgi:transcriptional regulator with XRE-family HTH domain